MLQSCWDGRAAGQEWVELCLLCNAVEEGDLEVCSEKMNVWEGGRECSWKVGIVFSC